MATKIVQYYATGRRKSATARVFLRPGTGKVTINGRDDGEYLHRPVLKMVIRQPLQVANVVETYDVWCTVKGGGLHGQADAIRHGVARALVAANPADRSSLKHAGYLRRDDRKVERKKYGRPGARKRFQFSKR